MTSTSTLIGIGYQGELITFCLIGYQELVSYVLLERQN